ncbi:MAG: hypothetical protein ACP5NX_01675 [Candidatus Bilamarchaeaceae archaeon]
MSQANVEKVTKDAVKQGGVLAMLYFDLHGTDAKALTQLSVGFIQQLLKEKGVIYAVGEIDKPVEGREIASTYLQAKVLAKSFPALVNLCAMYSPFSMEILEPSELKLDVDKMQEILVTISQSTQEYKKYILEKTLSKEDLERYKVFLQRRIDLGKKLMEQGGSE